MAKLSSIKGIKAPRARFDLTPQDVAEIRHFSFSNKIERENGTLILHTLLGRSKIGSLFVSPKQQNEVDITLATWSPLEIDRLSAKIGNSGNYARASISKINALENSFFIPDSNPKVFLFSDESKILAFILGKPSLPSFSASANNSISLLLAYDPDRHNVDHNSFLIHLETPTVILKEGDVADFYGAAIKNDKWIACYKAISDGHDKCLVGSMSLSEKDGSVSKVSLKEQPNDVPIPMIAGCSMHEMKIEGMVSSDDLRVNFIVYVMLHCPSRILSPYVILTFQIKSSGELKGFTYSGAMKNPSAIQTAITSSNNFLVCRDEFSQISSDSQADPKDTWNLMCYELSFQSNSPQCFVAKMKIDQFEDSIAGGSPFKYLALTDFAGKHIKISGYAAGSEMKWDHHNFTNIFSYVKVDQANMTVNNIFFRSLEKGSSSFRFSYVADRSYMKEAKSVDTFILGENKDADSVCNIFTLDSGKIEWSCRGIGFSLKTGEHFFSVEKRTGADPFYSPDAAKAKVKYVQEGLPHSPIISGADGTRKLRYDLKKSEAMDQLFKDPTIAPEVDSDGMANGEKEDDYASGVVESSASSGADYMYMSFSPIAMMAIAAVSIPNLCF